MVSFTCLMDKSGHFWINIFENILIIEELKGMKLSLIFIFNLLVICTSRDVDKIFNR